MTIDTTYAKRLPDLESYTAQEPKYIIANKQIIELTKNAQGFWQNDKGTLYAYKDGATTDPKDVCGVAPLDLPSWPFFQVENDQCAKHDFMYSSLVYQAFHTRSEADTYLQRMLDLVGHPLIGDIFSEIARLLGAPFWENKATND